MSAVDEGASADRTAPNVVSLRGPIPRDAASAGSRLSPQSAATLNQARAIAERHLAVTVTGVLQAADNTLFELAQKSDQSSVQSDYFAGMRVLRRRRPMVEQAFSAELRRAFAVIERHEAVSADGTAGEMLELVSDEALEEDIAIASIVNAVHGFASRMLFPINERMTALVGGGYQVGDHNNPIAPRSMAQMMRASLRDVDLVPNVRLILLKLFERATLEQCEKLYAEINAALLAAGVLPSLRISARREDGRGAPSDASHSVAGISPSSAEGFVTQGAHPSAHGAAHVEAGDSEVYAAVLALLQSRHGAAPVHSQTLHAALPMSGNELRSLLTILQAQALPQDSNNWIHTEVASLQQVKASLAEQARAVGVDPKRRHMAHADEDTIDLVGMLFEVILDDRNLHPKVKSLLSRLMVPYIKLALIDRHLFLQRSHPARRLLNEMSNALVGFQDDNEQDERLLAKVAAVVEALLNEFDEDASVFQRLEADFTDFFLRHRKRSELVEQRAAETVRGRERLSQARRNSHNEFEARVSSKDLPKLVKEVLARYWTHHLTITELRQGVDSPDYRDALQLGSQLVAAAETRVRGGRGLPAARVMDLRERLARVLALAGCGADQAQPILEGLVAIIDDPVAAAPEPRGVIEAASQMVASSPAAVVAEEEEPQVSTIAPADMPTEKQVVDHLDAAGAITLGKWVDFIGTNGEAQQAKLAWISPISNRLLFVNRRGLKVGLYSLQELAALLAVERLRLHDGVPAFDRAMRTVVEKLGTQTHARA